MKSISKIKHLFFALFLLSACAKHNAGIVKQTYHDLTSHYNGYFNANENFNLQLKSLQSNRVENYDEILPLFAYGSLDEIQDKNAPLTLSIEKARLSIQTHQEKTQGKNYKANEDNSISNWSDDAFLLIGKSYYLQGELDSAVACFRYITANFDESVDARSKKKIKKQKSNKKSKAKAKKKEDKQIELEKQGKDIRPKKKLLVHETTKSEALVWLANSYISKGEYGKAEAILTYIKGDKTFLRNYDKDVELSTAYLYLSQGSYSTAQGFVQSTLEKTKKQKHKARLQFILGQLHEETGNDALAAEFYKSSIKGNPNFEMIFYAKLKIIQMNRKSNSNSKETLKLIAKLTKDNKNKDYFDQLYYEKAMIALNDNDRELAKKHLVKSTELSTNNTKQKGLSYIKLAEINYEEEAYSYAQAFYDSSLMYIEEAFPQYNEALNRSKVLGDLIDNLTTIKTNDSLLVLAEMPAKELESYLYKQAVDLVDAEIKAEEKNKQSNVIANSSTSDRGDKNAWYFYSEASRNSGYKKFKQIWGEIVLEDNWRRSEKGSDGGSLAEDEVAGEDDYFDRIDVKYDAMLAAVPNGEEGKKQLTKDIVSSYYNAAVIYKIGLENEPKSIEMFEAMNSRFDGNKYEAEALYQLYVIHNNRDEKTKADQAKATLLKKYPDSKFAGFIKNPKQIDQLSSKDQVAKFYEESYNLYTAENYDAVIQNCEEANEKYANTKLMAKFDLLKAMAIGGKKLYDPFVSSLEYVVNTHKATEEQAKAEEMLAYLRGEKTEAEIKAENKSKILDNKPINNKPLESESQSIKQSDPESSDGKGLKIKLGKKEINLGKKGSKEEADDGVE